MEIKFNKFTITSDSRQFILYYHDDKHKKNYYYGDFESLIKNLLNKHLLKSDLLDLKDVIREIRMFNDEIQNLSPELKKLSCIKLY